MRNLVVTVLLLAGIAFPYQAIAANKLFVGGLAWGTTSDEVLRLVSPYGVVTSVEVRSIDSDGKLKANALVSYDNDASVDAAISALDGLDYMGEPLSAKKPREIVVVGSKVKEVVRNAGLRSDGELVQAVSDQVYDLLDEAIFRATSNGRSTVRPYDL